MAVARAERTGGEAGAAGPEPVELVTARGRPARIALVHDWLESYYGSERVVGEILRCFPDADLFALVDVMPDDQRAFLQGKRATTSFIQRLPLARRRFRGYLPLMPLAIEQFDLSAYDLVLSSSHALAKGVITGPDQLHVAYVHAPMRYAWEYQHQYLRGSRLGRGPGGWLLRYLFHRLRLWDQHTANGVDRFVANSAFIARRIEKIYRRESAVVHPPVAVDEFRLCRDKDAHFLAVSRFVPYKHTETIVEAFRALPGHRLIVVGDGPGLARARRQAPANVTLLGWQPRPALIRHMEAARALVFAAEEDFGITPVEAQAAGTPVIAYGRGGARETVRGLDEPDPTGLFFDAQTPEAIAAAVRRFAREAGAIDAGNCRANAQAFTPARFRHGFVREVVTAWRTQGGSLAPASLARLARSARLARG